MTQPSGPQQPPMGGPSTPEADATRRINALQEAVKKLEGEIKTLQGQFKNRDPALTAALQAGNKVLRERLDRLERAYLILASEKLDSRNPEDLTVQTEALRVAAVDFCKKANINPEIWKNIVY